MSRARTNCLNCHIDWKSPYEQFYIPTDVTGLERSHETVLQVTFTCADQSRSSFLTFFYVKRSFSPTTWRHPTSTRRTKSFRNISKCCFSIRRLLLCDVKNFTGVFNDNSNFSKEKKGILWRMDTSRHELRYGPGRRRTNEARPRLVEMCSRFRAREPACPRKDSAYQLPMREASASRATFLFSFESRLSFHGNLIQEPFAGCLENRTVVKNVKTPTTLFFFHLSSFYVDPARDNRINEAARTTNMWLEDRLVLNPTTVIALSKLFSDEARQGIRYLR